MREFLNRKRDLVKYGVDKEAFQLLLYPAVLFASVFFFFGPIQMYVSNITELWFPIHDALLPCFVTFLIVSIILVLLGRVIMRNDVALHVYVFLLWGLGIALYIQGNFIPSDYGVLNGASVDWDAHAKEAMMDAVFWVCCLLLPYFLRVFAMKYYRAVIRYTSGGLFLAQLVALVILLLTTDFSQSAISDSYLSDAGLYEVSDEQNVIIFILDTFDQDFFEEIYEEDPEYVSFLDGFTYFDNATGPYPNTRAALPYILTGQYYENEQPYNNYIDEAWENCSDYYQALMNQGFDIGLYTSDWAVSSDAKGKWASNAVNDSLKVSSYVGLENAFLQLTAMRYFPDFIKKNVWSYEDLFEQYKQVDATENELFNWEGSNFYRGLISNGLSVNDGKKYKLIHLDGTHEPYTILEDVSEASQNEIATAVTEAKGCINLLREYIKQLKELNIYDQSCIIITGDHGSSRYTKTSPILIAKGFNSHGNFAFSDRPVSHSNLKATIMGELGIELPMILNNSIFEDSDLMMESRRYLQYTLNDSYDKNYLPDMVEYEIMADNNSADDYILTGKIYTSNGVIETIPYQYTIGNIIKFSDTEALSYFVNGTPAYVEGDFVWSSGSKGRACFQMTDIQGDIICHIDLHEYIPTGAQHVLISSLGNVLFDNIIKSGMTEFNFVVPKECVQNDLLILDFSYPDACSSKELGLSEDTRELSIGFKQIYFEYPKNIKNDLYSKVIFSSSLAGNAGEYVGSGWYAMEENSAWTSDEASILTVLPSENDQKIAVSYWTHPGAKDTSVYYNNHFVETLPHHDEGNKTKEIITLPSKYKADSEIQTITFITEGATSSKAYYGGNVTDERILGIAVSEIDVIPLIQLDSDILFSDDASRCYFESGVAPHTEENLLWSIGNSSRAVFGTGEIKNNLLFRIRLHDWMPGGTQHVIIRAQDMTLYDGSVTNDTPYIYFSVPMECVHEGLLTLDFEYPDACSPKSLGGSEDERILAIGFKEIYFTEQEETTELYFNDMGNTDDLLISGWHDADAGWQWTDSAASLAAMLPENEDYEMHIRYWTHPGARETAVYYNGELIGHLPHHGEDELETVETVILPKSNRVEDALQQIMFVTDGAMTSREYYGGDITDDRVLGIAVVEILFSAQE